MTLPAETTPTAAPTRQQDIENAISEYLSGELDYDNKELLVRAISDSDRLMFRERMEVLRRNMAPAEKKEISKAIINMMTGFKSSAGDTDHARATTAQYVKSLLGLPMWAITKACERWERGQVEPSEVGSKSIDRAFPPTTAELNIIATKYAEPFWLEVARIGKVLSARVRRPDPTPEERERVKAKFADLSRRMHEATDKMREEDRAAQKRLSTLTADALLNASARLKPPSEQEVEF